MYKTAVAGFTKKRANHRDFLGSWLLLPLPRAYSRGAVFDCLLDLQDDVSVPLPADLRVTAVFYNIFNCFYYFLIHISVLVKVDDIRIAHHTKHVVHRNRKKGNWIFLKRYKMIFRFWN